ncbi:MAG: DUF4105 domain-containing protein [Candidatus Latescibacteria bacterium]|nr:DUF4105 domain-containing protein [Candidatus Latescibacterota bacterium]
MRSRFLQVVVLGWLTWVADGHSQETAASGPVYLVYAGPFSTSPSSSFGHVLLVQSPSPDTPVPMWDALSFTAETHQAGPLRFLTVGIMGGFLGHYRRLKFYQKTRDYQTLEDRDLWLLELTLTDEQHKLLAASLERKGDLRYPYTFFHRNCAYYIQTVLADVVQSVPYPRGMVSPIEVYRLAANSDAAGGHFFRPAESTQVRNRLLALGDSTAQIVLRSEWQTLATNYSWLRDLNHKERLIIHEYLEWRTLRLNTVPADEVTEGLKLLRRLNAESMGSPLADRRRNVIGAAISPPRFHQYGKVTASGQIGGDHRLGLRYRPGVHDLTDPWEGHRPINTMEALALEISVSAWDRPSSLRLEEFVVFSQRSLSPVDAISAKRSWLLDVAVRRPSTDSELKGSVRYGTGYAKQILRSGVHMHALLGGSLESSIARTTVAIDLQGGISAIIGRTWSGGLETEWRGKSALSSVGHRRFVAWLHHDMPGPVGIGARAVTDRGSTSGWVSISTRVGN